jgi:hypothetical protein
MNLPNIKMLTNLTTHQPIAQSNELISGSVNACKASENGKAVMIDLPAGWSFEHLKECSEAAVARGIPSARINFSYFIDKKLMRPIKEAQTVILTDTTAHQTRNWQSIQQMTRELKNSGLEETLPDALTVLTAAVFMRIATHGQKGLYDEGPRTLCSQKAKDHPSPYEAYWTIRSSRFGIEVRTSDGLDHDYGIDLSIGAGGQLRFLKSKAK